MAQFPFNLGGGGGAALDEVTAGAPQILEGYTGVNADGDAVAGTMPDHRGENITVTPSFTSTPNGYFTMRVPERGCYDSAGRLQVAGSELGNAEAAHVLDTKTFTSRYGIKEPGGIPTKAAATIYPALIDTILAAAQYLGGAQTIKAVKLTNLLAANVKYGATVQVGDAASAGRLASVAGSFTGDCNAVAAQIRTGYKAAAKGVVYDGALSINSATSFSVVQRGNNSVRVTCSTPAAATGRPWGGLYVRGKVGSYPTSVSDGFFVGRIGTNPTYVDYTSASNMPNGATVYFRGWDYVYYNTQGSSASYPNVWYGNQHNIGAVTIGYEGYATITASGSWSLPTGANRVEFFAVGAGGGTPAHHFAADDSAMATGGGGGGYTAKSSALSYAAGTSFTIVIGAGVAGGDGGSTVVKQGSTTLLTAAGGKTSLYALNPTESVGGNGGSGGGGGYNYGGNGGSGGNNGSGSSTLPSGGGTVSANGGTGQGTSTTFNGVTYSGGGGGGTTYTSASRSSGGSWGGGSGGYMGVNGTNGTANSGGGAGGGSGQGGSADPSARTGGSGVVIAHYYHS